MAKGVCHKHLFPTMKKIFTFILLSMIAFNTIHAEITWDLSDDGTLTISGTDMPEYPYFQTPWDSQRDYIKKVVINNGVTNIGKCAFYECLSITSVTIPNSVTSIGGAAFADCSGLTTITCEATTPPNCLAECFYNVKKNIPVYVPSKSVNSYKKADVWKYFYNLQAIDYTVTLDNNKGIGGSEQVTV